MKVITVEELLEWLDGRGLCITDDDLIDEALAMLHLTQDTELSWITKGGEVKDE